MPMPRFTPEELRQLHDLTRQWAKIVSKRAFGDDGPGLGVDFRTFEQIATAAHGLTEGTLRLLLEQQAGKLPEEQPCPECGKLCPTQSRTRPLTAQGATVQHAERIAHCPEVVVVVDGGRIRTRAAGGAGGVHDPRTRRTRSPVWRLSAARRSPPTRAPKCRTRSSARVGCSGWWVR